MRLDWTAAVMVAAAGLAAPAMTSVAAAQPGSPTPSAPAAPDAAPRQARSTIVERTADGQLQRLQIPAEERAAQVMDLDANERERVARVLRERADMLDEIVVRNFDLLSQMHAATIAGDAAEARRLSGMYMTKLERLTDRGRFEDEVRPELRLDHQEEFSRLITEYRQALLQQASRESKAEGKDLKPQVLADREMRRAMAREVQRSYERAIVGTPVTYDAVLGGLGLKPEQESKARQLVAEFNQSYGDKATPEQRRDLLMKVLKELDDEQRLKLVKAVRGS